MGLFNRRTLILPRMVRIKPGRFIMGSPESETAYRDSESPQHEVKIDYAFEVGKYPVTFREWDSAARLGACEGYLPPDRGWGRGWKPVINVSWEDAQAYIRFLNERTGRRYRLLTEAEWEYCCRAGTTTAYAFGDTLTSRKQGVVFSYNRTVEVRHLWANKWGLVSMHGNVFEWVEDCWNDSYEGAPSDGSERTTGNCSIRVYRGGSWFNFPLFLRSASRGRNASGYRKFPHVGFRLARTLPD
ncbi:formylglycine-generating enzyme family protein [Hyphomonadaceae bacterium BL14]|nr:formylglycine-generating enzyme family protein [Hyphomonadaceae bacterium BL14]